MVTFRPGVADAQDGLPWQLALKREEIILGIGIGIPRWRRGHAGLRVINIVEWDGVRMARRGIERWKCERIRRSLHRLLRQIMRRGVESVENRPAQTVGRLGFVDAERISFND